MIRAVTILTENFSDWETALINSAGRNYYGFETRFASPGGQMVTSSGGLMVTPHMAIEDISLDHLDLLIICGGTIWRSKEAPDIRELVINACHQNIVVAGICDGTRVLAQAGLLDTRQHTSNSADNLLDLHYGGADYYQDVPWAVTGQRVITAPGTAPVSLMVEILRSFNLYDDNIKAYQAMHKAEHV